MKRFLFLSLALLPAIAFSHPRLEPEPIHHTEITAPAQHAELAISTRADSAQKGSTVMEKQIPTIGRTVHYKLSEQDAEAIARRRTTGSSIAERIPEGKWPVGAQAHIGNPAMAGATVPLIVTAVWPDEYGPGVPGVNGQALLDGTDSLWVTSAKEGGEPGTWSWPSRS